MENKIDQLTGIMGQAKPVLWKRKRQGHSLEVIYELLFLLERETSTYENSLIVYIYTTFIMAFRDKLHFLPETAWQLLDIW